MKIGKDSDDAAFEKVLLETQEHVFVRILSDCLMPNHGHLVLWPLHDGDLGRFMQRLTTTYVRRWHLHRHTVGTGHLYQGTYKSLPLHQLPPGPVQQFHVITRRHATLEFRLQPGLRNRLKLVYASTQRFGRSLTFPLEKEGAQARCATLSGAFTTAPH